MLYDNAAPTLIVTCNKLMMIICWVRKKEGRIGRGILSSGKSMPVLV